MVLIAAVLMVLIAAVLMVLIAVVLDVELVLLDAVSDKLDVLLDAVSDKLDADNVGDGLFTSSLSSLRPSRPIDADTADNLWVTF